MCNHLEKGPEVSAQSADELGRAALACGMEPLGMAKIHSQVLTTVLLSGNLSGTRQRIIERARNYFAETLVPIEKTHSAALKTAVRVNQMERILRRLTDKSTTSSRCLKTSIILRHGAEKALKKSGKRRSMLVAELRRLQKHLRYLAREVVSAQEDDRKNLSRQLHDDIAQTLLAINIRLITLKNSAKAGTKSLKKEIENTQKLVAESVKRVNQFANECGRKDAS